MDAPSPARVYDALLGGSHNFEIDRMVAERAARNVPDLPASAAANRRFLHRAVTYLATEAGVRQFIDLGAGIPTVGNTHEILDEVAPGSTVVYVDIDAVAVAHATAILAGNDRRCGDPRRHAGTRGGARGGRGHRAGRPGPPGRPAAGGAAAPHPRRRRARPR